MNVSLGKLPVLFRFVQAVQEAPLLLLSGYMKKKFSNDHPVAREIVFEIANIFKTFFPDFLGYQLGRKVLLGQKLLVYANHQHFFIVRAIEDADLAALRQSPGGAPEKVMVQFFYGRLLETGDLASLGIHAGHDVLDQAVFAGGVHGLKDQQDRPLVLCVKLFLELLQHDNTLLQELIGLVLGMNATDVGGIIIFQPKRVAVFHPKCICQLQGFLCEFHRICCIPKQALAAKATLCQASIERNGSSWRGRPTGATCSFLSSSSYSAREGKRSCRASRGKVEPWGEVTKAQNFSSNLASRLN